MALARVSRAPYGAAAWKAYHQRFYERFGIGSMVPLLDVVADSGIGYPDGYPGRRDRRAKSPVSQSATRHSFALHRARSSTAVTK